MLKAISRLVDFITWIISFLLFARFVLRFLEAGTRAPFTNWLYTMTADLMIPFEGIFPTYVLSTGNIIDVSAIAATLVYGLVGYALSSFLDSIADHIAYRNRPREPEIAPRPINSVPQNYNQPTISQPIDPKN